MRRTVSRGERRRRSDDERNTVLRLRKVKTEFSSPPSLSASLQPRLAWRLSPFVITARSGPIKLIALFNYRNPETLFRAVKPDTNHPT